MLRANNLKCYYNIKNMKRTEEKITVKAIINKINEPILVGDKEYVPGEYLVISISNNEDVYIPFGEFKKEWEKPSEKQVITAKDSTGIFVGDSMGLQKPPEQTEIKRGPLYFILNKLDLNIKETAEDVYVSSTQSIFLELPWEELKDNVYVFRKVISTNNYIDRDVKKHGMGILTSQAHIINGQEVASLKEKIKEEVKDIITLSHKIIDDELPKSLKLVNLSLYLHLTRQQFKDINFKDFSFLHFAMHGLSDGAVLLESDVSHNDGEKLSKKEILTILNDNTFNIIFLSYCFSGGDIEEQEGSLAFDIINKGISKYVISYKNTVGEGSAKEFALIFYGLLMNGIKDSQEQDDIENLYKKSLRDFFEKGKKIKNVPFLYIHEKQNI